MPLSPDVVADPLGVIVSLVGAVEDQLGPDEVRAVAEPVTGGRAKRRRVAQALWDNPSVLNHGRSPAPRAVGELLVALRAAGARRTSAPRCTGCAKPLRSFHRRGEDWYCNVCGPARKPCTACGALRRVGSVDRDGRPFCAKCRPQEDDPVDVVCRVVRRADPTLSYETVAAAVAVVTSRAGQRRQLAWALQDRPELLTGAGAEAPVPSVLRLIDALCEAGATNISRPGCPHCGRAVPLLKVPGKLRLCRNCVAEWRAVPCARCGTVREPGARDDLGLPLCSDCLNRDPANCEACTRCQRHRPVSARTPEGPLCETCRPLKQMACSVCGRPAPCEVSKATGEPWCRACQKRWARCARCGQVRPVRSGSSEGPLCSACTPSDPSFWKRCPGCGEAAKLVDGPCRRCAVREQLRRLLSGADGAVRPDLEPLYENLATTQRPDTVLGWLNKSRTSAVLEALGSGRVALSHTALDELPSAKPVEHLRAVLVAAGALPGRDEQMARLERWVADSVAAREDPEERQLLQRYGMWNLLRRLRRRHNGSETTYGQAVTVKRRLRAATALLDWLRGHGLDLATCDQGHLDAWLASGGAAGRGDVGHFVRWAADENLTGLDLPAARWAGPRGAIDAEKRWDQARWLLGDDAVSTEDRVAGLLVLLYAQRASTISRLTLSDVGTRDQETQLRLGPRPIVLPEPLAGLVLQLVSRRHGHAVLGDQGTSLWLFPGGQPGRPISASRLAERLRELGVHAGLARSSALLQLATELPAAVIARMLGVHIKVAVEWQRASGGDWTSYAADYSRRKE